MIAGPKQSAWKLVAAGVASTGAFLCMLSSAAMAQDMAEVPAEDIQSANRYIDDLSTTGGTTLQDESEPLAGGAVTAKPSEFPWLMDQQRFGPEAAPAQIPNGGEQISEANQPLMEDDLGPTEPIQERLAPTGAESVTIDPVTEVPEISSPPPEESAASNASARTREPGASDPTDGTRSSKPPLGVYERQLLGLGIIALSFVLASLIVLWKIIPARVSILDIIRGKSKRTYHARADEPKSSMRRAEWPPTEVPRRSRCHRVKHDPRRREHRKYKDL